jgi:hypothetical protein
MLSPPAEYCAEKEKRPQDHDDEKSILVQAASEGGAHVAKSSAQECLNKKVYWPLPELNCRG